MSGAGRQSSGSRSATHARYCATVAPCASSSPANASATSRSLAELLGHASSLGALPLAEAAVQASERCDDALHAALAWGEVAWLAIVRRDFDRAQKLASALAAKLGSASILGYSRAHDAENNYELVFHKTVKARKNAKR